MGEIDSRIFWEASKLSKTRTERTKKVKKIAKARVKTSRATTVPHKRKRVDTYRVVDVANNGIVEKAYENGVQIIARNQTDFRECVNLFQGPHAVVFRTTHLHGLREYSIVFFFPYQGYLIMYAEPTK